MFPRYRAVDIAPGPTAHGSSSSEPIQIDMEALERYGLPSEFFQHYDLGTKLAEWMSGNRTIGNTSDASASDAVYAPEPETRSRDIKSELQIQDEEMGMIGVRHQVVVIENREIEFKRAAVGLNIKADPEGSGDHRPDEDMSPGDLNSPKVEQPDQGPSTQDDSIAPEYLDPLRPRFLPGNVSLSSLGIADDGWIKQRKRSYGGWRHCLLGVP